jgi:glycerol-3-phosphate acyltransferase PlsY
MLLVDPQVTLAGFVVGFTVIYLTRYVSAGSLIGTVATVVVAVSLDKPWWELLVLAIISCLMFYQHRENIVRLRAGTESRFGQKSPTPPGPAVAKTIN